MPDALDGVKNNKGKNYIVNSYLFVRKQLMLQRTLVFFRYNTGYDNVWLVAYEYLMLQ